MAKYFVITTLALVLTLLLVQIYALPVQELPPRKGHVPVYIRLGDQPLTEVHPSLAVAFHELDNDAAFTAESLILDKLPMDTLAKTPATTTSTTESDIADPKIVMQQSDN